MRGLNIILNMDIPECHNTDRLKEKDWKEEAANVPPSEIKNINYVFSQTNTGTVLRATLGRLLRDGGSTYGPFEVLRYCLERKLETWIRSVEYTLWLSSGNFKNQFINLWTHANIKVLRWNHETKKFTHKSDLKMVVWTVRTSHQISSWSVDKCMRKWN